MHNDSFALKYSCKEMMPRRDWLPMVLLLQRNLVVDFKFIVTKEPRTSQPIILSRLENPYGKRNDQRIECKSCKKYGVYTPSLHRIITPKKWASGSIKSWLEKILERTIGDNRAPGRDKLDDALRALTAQSLQNTAGCTPYKLVYGKA
ncbi:hypothetical protein Tco_1053700 [Tanacetum coccineum]|uniref:Reverse transcriptase n=1 Tax=Tanacetum coccineum TaxID=301880 RepID=A0ABQ5GX44_9ASTR